MVHRPWIIIGHTLGVALVTSDEATNTINTAVLYQVVGPEALRVAKYYTVVYEQCAARGSSRILPTADDSGLRAPKYILFVIEARRQTALYLFS